MVADLIRDAPFGQLVRLITRNRVFQYPEEKPDFQCPSCYSEDQALEKPRSRREPSRTTTSEAQNDAEKVLTPNDNDTDERPINMEETVPIDRIPTDVEKADSSSQSSTHGDFVRVQSSASHLQRQSTLPYTPERLAADQAMQLERTQSKPITPARTADGVILVDWYTTDDLDNPQNWSQAKKAWTAFLIDMYTFVVYASSSIYISSQLLIMERFGVQEFKASLGLALYVLGKSYLSSPYLTFQTVLTQTTRLWHWSSNLLSPFRSSRFRTQYTIHNYVCTFHDSITATSARR